MIEKELLGDWVDALASKAPVPGGGGTSALGGALAAALGQMIGNLTVGKKRYAEVEREVQLALVELKRLQEAFFALAEEDETAFTPLSQAYKLPTETEEQRQEKERVMEECLRNASIVPMRVAEQSVEILEILAFLGEKGSRMAISDAGVAAAFARAALQGAVMNVYINTKSMKDRETAEAWNQRAMALTEIGTKKADAIYDAVLRTLGV